MSRPNFCDFCLTSVPGSCYSVPEMWFPFRFRFEKRVRPLPPEVEEAVAQIRAALEFWADFEERLSKVTTMAETTRKKVYRAEGDASPDNAEAPTTSRAAIRTGDPPPPGYGE